MEADGGSGGSSPWVSTGARLAAIVLAGGQARRLGGVDKPAIRLGQRSLAGAVVGAAVRAGADRVVVVGPDRPELAAELALEPGRIGQARIEFARDRPPGGGPVPALRAGLDQVGEPWLLLLAGDLPFLTAAALRGLVEAAGPRGGAVVADPMGQPQWLLSCWRTADLRDALAGYAGSSLRGLLEPLPHVDVAAAAQPGDPPYWLDCDTPDDLATAERIGRHPIPEEQP